MIKSLGLGGVYWFMCFEGSLLWLYLIKFTLIHLHAIQAILQTNRCTRARKIVNDELETSYGPQRKLRPLEPPGRLCTPPLWQLCSSCWWDCYFRILNGTDAAWLTQERNFSYCNAKINLFPSLDPGRTCNTSSMLWNFTKCSEYLVEQSQCNSSHYVASILLLWLREGNVHKCPRR